MISVTGNTATFKVDGPAAHTLAKNLLSNLGMTAEDIDGGSVDITFGGDHETEVSIEAEGPLAGIVLAGMTGGIPFEENEAVAIDATFIEEASDGSDADGDGEAGGSDADDEPVSYQPQVTPLVGKVNPEYVHFPSAGPARLNKNTKLHAVGALLLEWYDTVDDTYVSSNTLGDFAGDEFTTQQVQGSLSRLFVDKGLVVRRQRKGGRGRSYEYHPTQQLREEVERLGEYDLDAVEQRIASAQPNDAGG